MSKREKSELLYAELASEGYALPTGTSRRRHFIDRAIMEHGMTEKGAATYYVNAKTKHEGGQVANYYKPKTARAAVGKADAAVDSRWSVVLIKDGKVSECHPFATEEKARSMFLSLRPENKAMCVVVPGIMPVGEVIAYSPLDASGVLISSQPGDIAD